MINYTNEKDAKIAKVVVIIIVIVFMAFLETILLPEEIAYFTSGKTSAVICSDGYVDKHYSLFTGKGGYYNYVVEYEVNGQKYTSQRYRSSSRKLQKGNVVTLHYDSSNPQDVKYVRLPSSSIVLIICIIVIIYDLMKDKTSK